MLKTMLAIWKTQEVGSLKNLQDSCRDLRDCNIVARLVLRRKMSGIPVLAIISLDQSCISRFNLYYEASSENQRLLLDQPQIWRIA